MFAIGLPMAGCSPDPFSTIAGEAVTVLGWYGSALIADINLRGVEGTQTQTLLGARAAINHPWPDLTGSSNWPVLSADGRRMEYRAREPR